MLDYIAHALRVITGEYQVPYLKEWDYTLNDMINCGVVIDADDYAVTFQYNDDFISVWVGNRWYSFGYAYCSRNSGLVPKEFRFRPRFKTMKKLWALRQQYGKTSCIARKKAASFYRSMLGVTKSDC